MNNKKCANINEISKDSFVFAIIYRAQFLRLYTKEKRLERKNVLAEEIITTEEKLVNERGGSSK